MAVLTTDDGGNGRGGTGGVRRAPARPLAADGAAARCLPLSPRFFASAGHLRSFGRVCAPCANIRPRGGARLRGIGQRVRHGRTGAVRSVQDVFCGRP